MSKQHEIQLSKEIEKMVNEVNVVYLMFKVIAAKHNIQEIMPLADELKRIMVHIETDVKELVNDINES